MSDALLDEYTSKNTLDLQTTVDRAKKSILPLSIILFIQSFIEFLVTTSLFVLIHPDEGAANANPSWVTN